MPSVSAACVVVVIVTPFRKDFSSDPTCRNSCCFTLREGLDAQDLAPETTKPIEEEAIKLRLPGPLLTGAIRHARLVTGFQITLLPASAPSCPRARKPRAISKTPITSA